MVCPFLAVSFGGVLLSIYLAFVFDQIKLLAKEVEKPVGQQDPKKIAEYRETIKVNDFWYLI